MEPCSIRTSGGPSCALELVKAGVRRVWLVSGRDEWWPLLSLYIFLFISFLVPWFLDLTVEIVQPAYVTSRPSSCDMCDV